VDGHGNRFDDRDAIAPGLTGVDAAVALLLAQDGITNGAICSLSARSYGKALRATAINRVGARLMGIRPRCRAISPSAGGLDRRLSGLLIAPITTIYYDTGFLIGLKGFVGAIIGGLASYPLALAGRNCWSGCWNPFVLLGQRLQGSHRVHADHPGAVWRSLNTHHVEDEE
jgi:branched-chain amino acid transport system permease protein